MLLLHLGGVRLLTVVVLSNGWVGLMDGGGEFVSEASMSPPDRSQNLTAACTRPAMTMTRRQSLKGAFWGRPLSERRPTVNPTGATAPMPSIEHPI